MSLRERLTALFSPTRRLLAPDAPVVSEGGALGGMEWVVPRAHCQYHRVDFSELSARRRAGAALLAARQHQSTPDARTQIAWSGGVAHIWVWSGEFPEETAPASEEVPWVPESLLRPAPLQDGVRLLASVEGCEGQEWKGGILRRSRWWADPPQADAWDHFLRGCGLAVQGRAPDLEEAGWTQGLWAARGWRLPASPARLERLAWNGLFGLLLLLMGWQLAAALTWSVARGQLDHTMDGLRAQAAPLLEARERAEAARVMLEGYSALAAQGWSDYVLMADIAQALPERDRLSGWRRDRERLQVEVQSVETDPRLYVTAFQGNNVLRDATAAPTGGDRMELDFTLAAPTEEPGGPL